ncbi:unnamed protein product [Pleuronectes platessa]|uniref:Uncharacterized protein n=1 Tax=Pleuronectes platessa TaxID=8262 RepID=A0A9N7ULL3_PLEPL|nr:unnamed protein product [Pleuronectes platessa]
MTSDLGRELPPPSLSLTPDTRQMFSGECFTLQCLTSQTNSSGWKLVHFSPDLKAGNFTSEETPASTGSWKWIIASCGVLLLIVIPLTVWLVCHCRYQKFCTWSCWPVSKQEVPAGVLPATKLDVTEVQ